MSTSAGREAPSPLRQSHRFSRNRATISRCSTIMQRSRGHSATDDTDFWVHLEAREEGRFTQEADHLFDTSYPWAV